MADYKQVTDALASGVEPALICSTCPWDRFCITPPSMTREDVDRQLEESKRSDEDAIAKSKAEGKDAGLGGIMGTLLTSMMVSGKDTQAQVCPVLVARMRGSEGRKIVDGVRSQMQTWDDSIVSV